MSSGVAVAITGSGWPVWGSGLQQNAETYVSFFVEARVKPSRLHVLDHRSARMCWTIVLPECVRPSFCQKVLDHRSARMCWTIVRPECVGPSFGQNVLDHRSARMAHNPGKWTFSDVTCGTRRFYLACFT